jgi:hypothetical protein
VLRRSSFETAATQLPQDARLLISPSRRILRMLLRVNGFIEPFEKHLTDASQGKRFNNTIFKTTYNDGLKFLFLAHC